MIDVFPVIGSRTLFPALRARSYLAHCAISPLSTAVTEAMAAYAQDYATLGVAALYPWMDQRAALKTQLAALVGAQPSDIALVASTSIGVLQVAWSIPWRGERVILFEREFPTNVTPWRQVARTFGLTVETLPVSGFGDGSGLGLTRLEEALRRSRVKLVAVSAVQFQTGLAMPLTEMGRLCHAHGAALFVDGIQAVGAVPVDVADVDFFVAGGHKWLMGPEGSAFAYVAPDAIRTLVPRLVSWLSHEDPVGFLTTGTPFDPHRPFRARADVFEVGMGHSAALAGLGAAVDTLASIGIERIAAHIQSWHDVIEPALVSRGFRSHRAIEPGARSGILSVQAPDGVDVQALVGALSARGVVTSAPENHLRIAPHWPNATDEVPHVLAAVDEALRAAGR